MISSIKVFENDKLRGCVSKGIFCFGGGKHFRRFLDAYPEIKILGVVDNYIHTPNLHVEGTEYPVFSFDKFAEECKSDTVLVLTSIYVKEMLEQLASIVNTDELCVVVAPSVVEAIGSSNVEELLRDVQQVFGNNKKRADVDVGTPLYGQRVLIWEESSVQHIAGSKALIDIRDILTEVGYDIASVHITSGEPGGEQAWSFQRSAEDWKRVYEAVPAGALLVLQHPFRNADPEREKVLRALKKEKNVRCIAVVHDAEKVRDYCMTPYMEREFSFMLRMADVFIVHNEAMKKYFLSQGIPAQALITLGLFDYLCADWKEKKEFDPRKVVYAGSMMQNKSPFLTKLKEISDVEFHLYGPYYEENLIGGGNIVYHGSIPPEELPGKLIRGFGLVWDGDSIDTCSGKTGDYLRFNNPHKLSLYLAAGLPVIIWKKAEKATFVKETNTGILIDSLRDISRSIKEMTREKYETIARNAIGISKKLREGYYTKLAIKEAEAKLYLEKK